MLSKDPGKTHSCLKLCKIYLSLSLFNICLIFLFLIKKLPWTIKSFTINENLIFFLIKILFYVRIIQFYDFIRKTKNKSSKTLILLLCECKKRKYLNNYVSMLAILESSMPFLYLTVSVVYSILVVDPIALAFLISFKFLI